MYADELVARAAAGRGFVEAPADGASAVDGNPDADTGVKSAARLTLGDHASQVSFQGLG